jgi:hypothetical protein
MSKARNAFESITALSCVLFLAGLYGCGYDGDSQGKSTCPKPGTHFEKTLSLSGDKIEAHLGHDDTVGACLSVKATSSPLQMALVLPSHASLQIPAKTFLSATEIRVSATASLETAMDFEITAEMFASPLRALKEIRVNTGLVKPAKPITVAANIPAELESRLTANDELTVFVQIFQAEAEGILDSLENIEASNDASNKMIKFDLLPEMFTNRRRADGTWEAIFVAGSTRIKLRT